MYTHNLNSPLSLYLFLFFIETHTAQLEAKKQAALQARKTGTESGSSSSDLLSIISVDKEEDSKARVTTLVQNGKMCPIYNIIIIVIIIIIFVVIHT